MPCPVLAVPLAWRLGEPAELADVLLEPPLDVPAELAELPLVAFLSRPGR